MRSWDWRVTTWGMGCHVQKVSPVTWSIANGLPGDDCGPFVPDCLQHWSWERAQTQVQWGWGWVKFEAKKSLVPSAVGEVFTSLLIKYSQDFTHMCDCVIHQFVGFTFVTWKSLNRFALIQADAYFRLAACLRRFCHNIKTLQSFRQAIRVDGPARLHTKGLHPSRPLVKATCNWISSNLLGQGVNTLYIFQSGYNLLGFAKGLGWWQPDTWWQANATVHSACSQRGGYWSCQDRRLPHVMTFSACIICCLLICCLALVVHVTAFWRTFLSHVGSTACKIFTWWEYDGLGPLVMRVNVQSWRRRAPQCSEPVVLTVANVARWCKENNRDCTCVHIIRHNWSAPNLDCSHFLKPGTFISACCQWQT